MQAYALKQFEVISLYKVLPVIYNVTENSKTFVFTVSSGQNPAEAEF